MEAESPVALAEELARQEEEVVVFPAVGGDAALSEVVPLRGNQVAVADHFVT